MIASIRKEIWLPPAIASLGLIAIAQYDFLTFHVLAEACAIIIGCMLFSAAWNTVRYTNDYFLLFLGTGYFWVAAIDILHVLAYPKMNLILVGTTNLATQFWIVGRFFEASVLLAGALVFFKANRGYLEFFGLGTIAIVASLLVLAGYFPDTYVEGVGLTQFKIQAEHLIIIMLGASLFFYSRSTAFKGERTRKLIITSLLFTIAAEFAFTAYVDYFDAPNMIGHLLKIFSFWMIYQALVSKILIVPYKHAHMLNEAIRQSPVGISLLNTKGENITSNPSYEKLMDSDTFYLIEGDKRLDISGDKTWLDTKGVRDALHEGKVWHGKLEVDHPSKGICIDDVVISPVDGISGQHNVALVAVTDVTTLEQATSIMSDKGNAITEVLIGSIAAVADLLENRDPYTSGHSNKVACMAVALGEELGLGANELEGLRLAGLIHDIGKIRVPMEILNKPGKLSAAEFAIIQEHPEIGYDVIKNIPFPWDVPNIVRSHHERWQGQGYPHGLVGDDIPYGGRILAVADVIESVTSHRPYRPALGIDKAFNILHEGRGTEFDPKIVDAADAIKDILATIELETCSKLN